MRYLTTLSFVSVVIGGILANYSVSPEERFYARFLVIGGVILAGMAWGIS